MSFKKIKHLNWQEYLCTTPIDSYIYQDEEYESQIAKVTSLIKEADAILIGAGAGLSTAAGISMAGKRFTDNFSEFIDKYGSQYMSDMYSAGFYPFPTQEAKWAYWSKIGIINQYDLPAMPLYKDLYNIVKNKEYFILTTNVDHQFYKTGFSADRIFATQGDYGKIQCAIACHSHTYDAEYLFREMVNNTDDCLIPSKLVPKCPLCGENMEMNLRCDNYFVEDEDWHESADRYADFLKNHKNKKIVLLELGVGFNTPVIIRFPFEKMLKENKSFYLIRLNLNEAVIPKCLKDRSTGINCDIAKIIIDIRKEIQ